MHTVEHVLLPVNACIYFCFWVFPLFWCFSVCLFQQTAMEQANSLANIVSNPAEVDTEIFTVVADSTVNLLENATFNSDVS